MQRFDTFEDPRRRILIQALAAGLLGASGRALADSIFGSPPSKLPAGQSIYRIQGTATVNDKPATMQTRISANDTIQTGKNSEIVFVVGGHSMLMRADSRMTLQGDKPQDSFIIAGLRLLTGKLLSVSRQSGMTMSTTTATIGIRGTGVYLESDPEETYFCTCYGVADVRATNDPDSRDTVTATHHDRPLYILAKEQKGKNVRRAGFRNHTDQELMLVETLVGRTPPFTFPGNEYNAPRRDY